MFGHCQFRMSTIHFCFSVWIVYGHLYKYVFLSFRICYLLLLVLWNQYPKIWHFDMLNQRSLRVSLTHWPTPPTTTSPHCLSQRSLSSFICLRSKPTTKNNYSFLPSLLSHYLLQEKKTRFDHTLAETFTISKEHTSKTIYKLISVPESNYSP